MTDSRVCVYGQTTPNILNKQNKQKLCAHSTVKVNITNDLVQMHIINHIIWLHCPLPIVIVVMIKQQYKTSALFIAQRSELVYMWPALSNDRSRDEQWPNYRHWINHNTNFCILLFMLDNQYMRTCAGVPLILSCSPVCNAYKYCSSPGSNSNPMTFSIEAIYNNISWLRYLDKRQDWRRRPVAKWTMNMWIQSHIISVFI